MPITEVIDAMCLNGRPAIYLPGRLLRRLDDLHVERADDSTCDSCGALWPCGTRLDLEANVECHRGLVESVWR